MKALARFCCYGALLTALAAGVAIVLVMVAPLIGETVMPAAEARKVAVSDRIAAWQERKAEEAAYAAKAASAAAEQAAVRPAVVQASPAPTVHVREVPAHDSAAARQKPKRTAKPAQQRENELALGYAPSPRPRIAYENVFGAMRDAAGMR